MSVYVNIFGTVFLICLVSIISLILTYHLFWRYRRLILAKTGLLEEEPGKHRCIACDLFDEERNACLVAIAHPRWHGQYRNRKTRWYDKCHWVHGEETIVKSFDFDDEKTKIKKVVSKVESEKPSDQQ